MNPTSKLNHYQLDPGHVAAMERGFCFAGGRVCTSLPIPNWQIKKLLEKCGYCCQLPHMPDQHHSFQYTEYTTINAVGMLFSEMGL